MNHEYRHYDHPVTVILYAYTVTFKKSDDEGFSAKKRLDDIELNTAQTELFQDLFVACCN